MRAKRLAFLTCIVFVFCAFFVLLCNFYFIYEHSKFQLRIAAPSSSSAAINDNGGGIKIMKNSLPIKEVIERRWNLLPVTTMRTKSASMTGTPKKLGSKMPHLISASAVWEMASSWVKPGSQVYPRIPGNDPQRLALMEGVLDAMATLPIVRAGAAKGGTQLKLNLTVEGGQKLLFKPMRSSRETVFWQNPYAGGDRHNGEIMAFHLSRILDFRWCPPSVGRVVNLKSEILYKSELDLRKTFFTKDNKTCLYGVCFYCTRKDPLCGDGKGGDLLEGAVVLWLPDNFKLKMFRHPWRRSYKKGTLAPWEKDDGYCEKVVLKSKTYSMSSVGDRRRHRLLDLIDIAVFDFLTGNADRHNYEVFEDFLQESIVLLIDNGKSFGNPHRDEVTILAPLYQCCRIRRSTWKRLLFLNSSRQLSAQLEELTANDPVAPLLTRDHLEAIDRRLQKVIDVIRMCLEIKKQEQAVLIDDDDTYNNYYM